MKSNKNRQKTIKIEAKALETVRQIASHSN